MNEICICGKRACHSHHRVFRSQCRPLIECDLNLIPLCLECHDKIHNGKGHKLDRLLKLQFQNNLEILFDKELLTREEIKDVLDISDKPLNRLLKPLVLQKGKYVREEVIRACLGGKLIIEEEEKCQTGVLEI